MTRVVVGMSGGVDSSVAAYLLKQSGYEVIGLFMRNWHEEDEGGHCTAEQDFRDVRYVADRLGIPYYTVDFSQQYWDRVFSHFLEEYRHGRTPNPDVLCNREIKFDAFKQYAEQAGAEYIATGHYADVRHIDGDTWLYRAVDENKDQTYFLNQLSSAQLRNVLFPLANITKPEVRRIATELGLSTAEKKDSTGICFIGERRFREFLAEYIPMRSGDIVDILSGKVVGQHNGVFYYTVGQRKGLGIGGIGTGEPWYVVSKDVAQNILYVSQGDETPLMCAGVRAPAFHYITRALPDGDYDCTSRIRHRQPLVPSIMRVRGENVEIFFKNPVRAVAEGQYVVVYFERCCVGGGTIEQSFSNNDSGRLQ